MGRAFSMHTVGGHIGYALAPLMMVTLGTALGWRGALVATGILGIVAALVLVTQMRTGPDIRAPRDEAGGGGMAAGVRVLFQPSMLSLFAFFTIMAMGFIGLQSFTPTALIAARDFAFADANFVLAGFLIGAPVGVLTGGVVADNTVHHNLVSTLCLLLSAALIGVAGMSGGDAMVMAVLYFGAGLSFGMALPSRDMVVRAITPKGASGKVFGFVYSGLDTGAAVSPVLFGWFVDIGHPMWIFLFVPLFLAIAAGIIVATARLAHRHSTAAVGE
jgi:predicted MFS family arabinose efflux permease